jgi:AhpD family alkylhydroperoxidase
MEPSTTRAAAPRTEARIDISSLAPAAYRALSALDSRAHSGPVPAPLLDLIKVRASQINGCAYCVDAHSQDARKGGEPDERVFAVSAWEEGPFFTAAERAALALTESMCRLSEGGTRVADELWAAAGEHFTDEQLAQLVMVIATINAWNRVCVAVRMVPESYQA